MNQLENKFNDFVHKLIDFSKKVDYSGLMGDYYFHCAFVQ